MTDEASAIQNHLLFLNNFIVPITQEIINSAITRPTGDIYFLLSVRGTEANAQRIV